MNFTWAELLAIAFQFLFTDDINVAAESVYSTDENIQRIKQQISDQQQEVAALQKEVATLLGEVRQRHTEFRGAGADGGLTISINYPHPGMENAEVSQEATDEIEKVAPATDPIPVMVVKPSALADVEGAMMQVIQQDAAMTGEQLAESKVPQPLEVKSPQQELSESIEAIDKLEALKTHYKYDMENVKRNYAA